MSTLFLIQKCVRAYDTLIDLFVKYTQDLLLLIVRVYVASIFFQSGWTKFDNLWDGGWFKTVFLFKNVYKLPYISPEIAAVLGTGSELIFSIFLALGIMARVGAAGLLGVTAVITFGVHSHFTHEFWALLLGVSLIMGPGRFSFDGWIRSIWNRMHSNAIAELKAHTIINPQAPQIVAKDKPNGKITLDNKIEPVVTSRLSKRKLIAEPDKLVNVKSLLKQKRQSKLKKTTSDFPDEAVV